MRLPPNGASSIPRIIALQEVLRRFQGLVMWCERLGMVSVMKQGLQEVATINTYLHQRGSDFGFTREQIATYKQAVMDAAAKFATLEMSPRDSNVVKHIESLRKLAVV